jgi:Zn-dependent protease
VERDVPVSAARHWQAVIGWNAPALLVGWLHALFSTAPGQDPPPLLGVATLVALVTIGLGAFLGLFVHECGHLVAARLVGHRVRAVRVGAGRELLTFRIGQVRWQFGAAPNGGETNHTASGQTKSYSSAAILLAGPAANLLLALLCFPAALRPDLLGEVAAVFTCQQLLVVVDNMMRRPPVPGLHSGSDGWKLRRRTPSVHEAA